MGKKVIIKGVGTMMAFNPDDRSEILTLGTLQSLRIDMTSEAEDIFGGDGVFPIDQLIRQKLIEVSATDAKLDLAAASIMLGDKVEQIGANRTITSTTLWAMNEVKKVKEVGDEGSEKLVLKLDREVAMGSDDTPLAFTIRRHPEGTALKSTDYTITKIAATGTEPAYSEVEIKESGAGAGDLYTASYKHNIDNAEIMTIFQDSVPFPVHIVHHGAFVQKSGKIRGVETELYSCLARGSFSIDAQRAAASASTVTLQVMDPELECGKLGTIKTFEMDKIACKM